MRLQSDAQRATQILGLVILLALAMQTPASAQQGAETGEPAEVEDDDPSSSQKAALRHAMTGGQAAEGFLFPHATYLHAEEALGRFKGYGMIRNSMFFMQGSGKLPKAVSMDMGYGSTINGGFAYEVALSPFGYALRPQKGIALGAMVGAGFDGVTGGRLHFSAHLSASAFLKLGTERHYLFVRADNHWVHRRQRRDGSPHAQLAGDELRLNLGLRVQVAHLKFGVAARASEMRGTRFFGGSLGLYYF